jgi:hypothetical protein
MSGAVIALLHASAETPGMPPCVVFEQTLADTGEGPVAAEVDFRPTDLSEIDVIQADLAEAEVIGEGPSEGATPSPVPILISAAPSQDPDLWLYRDRTVALLRRYMRLSIEVGRLPSLLGREFFRTRVTSYGASTFEDSVIFVHDVERSLEKLGDFDKKLIAKIVLQEYSQEEAAHVIGCGRRHAVRCYPEALDRVTGIFLKRGLLSPLPRTELERQKTCQGGRPTNFP